MKLSKPSDFTRSRVKMVPVEGIYFAKEYALSQGAPEGPLKVRRGKTYLENDWAYFYSKRRVAWNCNWGFFQAHFYRKPEKSLLERLLATVK